MTYRAMIEWILGLKYCVVFEKMASKDDYGKDDPRNSGNSRFENEASGKTKMDAIAVLSNLWHF